MRKPLAGGARTITVVLTQEQRRVLAERAAKRSKDTGRFVSISELTRQAVELYLATDHLFGQRIA